MTSHFLNRLKQRILKLYINRTARFLKVIFISLSILFLFLSGLFFGIVISDNIYFDKINSNIFVDTDSQKANILKLMDWIYLNCSNLVDKSKTPWYVIYEDLLPFHITARSIVDYGYGIVGHPSVGPCGSLSRVAIVLLQRKGIPVRKLQLLGPTGGHTMVSIFLNGKWRVFDVSFHFHWLNEDGEIATLEEIKSNPKIFQQIFESVPDYPYLFDETYYIRWEKFGKMGLGTTGILKELLGEKRFLEINTPYIYERPRLIYAIVSSIFLVIFFALYLILMKKKSSKDRMKQI